MFKAFREWCERVLRIPGDPEPPPGDEARTRRFRAAPNYYKYLLVVWGLKTFGVLCVLLPMEIGPLFAMLKFEDQPVLGTILIVLPQLVILGLVLGRFFSLALVKLDFEKRWYLVTDRSLRLREGVFHVREMTVTFANIQNISISQGPIQRALGIADLRVDTAGGASAKGHRGEGMSQNMHTAFFRGVDNANAIRELIQSRQRALRDSGLGDHEEEKTSHVMPGEELLAALRAVAVEATALRQSAA